MSNLSNIGFTATTQEEFGELIQTTYKHSVAFKTSEGAYYLYSDNSGAEFWIQFNSQNQCIGANPHYNGKSRRLVSLQNIVEREESELDGAFYCWAEPAEKNNPESGAYPFVFDVPDFKMIGPIDFPSDFQIQLIAFAEDLNIYDNQEAYEETCTEGNNYATISFVPTGLYTDGETDSEVSPLAECFFSGIIKEFEKKQNELTGAEFYWLLVETYGGEVDVVADPRFFEREPLKNGILQGLFWLSGKLIDPPKNKQ